MANAKTQTASPAKPAPVNMGKGPSGEDLPDFDKWDKIQTGFAPYWNPEEGAFCYGEVIAKDARDPEFIRYLILAHATHTCSRGPKDEAGEAAETVMVKKGETFSVSSFFSLAPEFDYQLYLRGKGINVPVMIKSEKQLKTSTAGRTVWKWDLRNDPKQTPMLAKHRGEWEALTAGDAGATRPQLPEEN